ncbi:MAG: hypothetical protein V4649_17295 [Bacteroidota bacterium]
MPLTLKNYTSELPKELVALAKKCKVRECDETAKGQFVSYVDEGKDSFDVAVNITGASAVTSHTCDCKSGDAFCRHKAALLIHITTGKDTVAVVKKRKKATPAETLLEQVEHADLREWVRTLINKNKDIELAFVHHFSVKTMHYTPADVELLIKNAIKAVAGTKKNIDNTLLKKLVELWASVLTPVLDEYLAGVANKTTFDNLHTIQEHCRKFQSNITTGSNKIIKFADELLQQTATVINNLQNDETWHKAVDFFIDAVPAADNIIRLHYLQHIKNIIDSCSIEKKTAVVSKLADQFAVTASKDDHYTEPYQKFIYELVAGCDLFGKYYVLFYPIRYDNNYNEKLIGMMISHSKLDIAEKFCRSQIAVNYKIEYNIPYLQLLKEIYTLQNNNKRLAEILTTLFPETFQFDDYLFITNSMSEDEKKKWRTKMLTRARHIVTHDAKARDFCYRLMDHEKNYRKMIDYIETSTPYRTILAYFEPMALTGKKLLLEAVIRKRDDYYFGTMSKSTEQDIACFPELYELTKKHYSETYLRMLVDKDKSQPAYYRTNRFLKYMEEQLSPQQ